MSVNDKPNQPEGSPTDKPGADAVLDKYIHGLDNQNRVSHWPKDSFFTDVAGNVYTKADKHSVPVGKQDNSVITQDTASALSSIYDPENNFSIPIITESVVASAARAALNEAARTGQPAPENAAELLASAEGAMADAAAAAASDPSPVVEETKTTTTNQSAEQPSASATSSTSKETDMNTTTTSKTAKAADNKVGFWECTLKVIFWALLAIAVVAAIIYGLEFALAYIVSMGMGEAATLIAKVLTTAVAVVSEVIAVRYATRRIQAITMAYETSNFDKELHRATAAAA